MAKAHLEEINGTVMLVFSLGHCGEGWSIRGGAPYLVIDNVLSRPGIILARVTWNPQ